MKTTSIVYASSSRYKMEESRVLRDEFTINFNGTINKIGSLFNFEFRKANIKEILECDLSEMVKHKARAAYSVLQVPCIVEHAGLILSEFRAASYPGGLTQPMWDALGADGFIKEGGWAGRSAVARAVVGYCDGMSIRVFEGETEGVISDTPRGKREFYWDTIFVPTNPDTGKSTSLTFAEIAEKQGLHAKLKLSQSRKAMESFLNFRLEEGEPPLFRHLL